MILHKKLKHFVAALVVLALTFAGIPVARADDELPEYRVAITPTIKEFTDLKPGETYTDDFAIKNTGKQDFNYTIGFAPLQCQRRELRAELHRYDKLYRHYRVDFSR